MIYFIKPSIDGPQQRIAFIASLMHKSCQIVPSEAPTQQIAYDMVDVVACEPFWDDAPKKEHKHKAFGATHETWAKQEICEAVALTMFTDRQDRTWGVSFSIPLML